MGAQDRLEVLKGSSPERPLHGVRAPCGFSEPQTSNTLTWQGHQELEGLGSVVGDSSDHRTLAEWSWGPGEFRTRRFHSWLGELLTRPTIRQAILTSQVCPVSDYLCLYLGPSTHVCHSRGCCHPCGHSQVLIFFIMVKGIKFALLTFLQVDTLTLITCTMLGHHYYFQNVSL